jgi:hypothetical protein
LPSVILLPARFYSFFYAPIHLPFSSWGVKLPMPETVDIPLYTELQKSGLPAWLQIVIFARQGHG